MVLKICKRKKNVNNTQCWLKRKQKNPEMRKKIIKDGESGISGKKLSERKNKGRRESKERVGRRRIKENIRKERDLAEWGL